MTVPANLFVATNPSVLAVGGADLVLNGVFLTNSIRVPIGTQAQFSDLTTVEDYFGGSSTEAVQAAIYFGGWDGSRQKPGNIIFVQYNTASVAAYLRGGDISGLPLATLQGYSGGISIVVNGAIWAPLTTVSLSAATSFSSAATILTAALNAVPPTDATFTGAITATSLNVTAISGALGIGSKVTGSGVAANTVITAFGTGTGGNGTYTVNNSQIISTEAMTATSVLAVTYDSTSGAFVITSGITGPASTVAFATSGLATNLLLTSATGAVLSQGAATASPTAFMAALASRFANWATFTTLFDPDISGFANKLLFAQWADSTNGRYAYSAWDTDPNAATELPASSSFGFELQTLNLSGTVLHWNVVDLASLWMGMVASVDFDQTGGRITFAYKSQSGISPTVTSETQFLDLAGNPQAEGSFGNGYNCYAAIATANQTFTNYQRGTISGPFKWSDTYINAIWLTNTMQVALMSLFATANSIPFNNDGAGQIRTALAPTIQQGLAFGAYAGGVTLSGSQIASVNGASGFDIATPLQNQGWFLLIQPATAAVRANRGPWQIVFYYVDQGSVQSITLSTVALQ